MSTSVIRNKNPRTACDICYKLKERCTRVATFARCVRCERLDLACSTVRPVRPTGRRPHREKQTVCGKTPPTKHKKNLAPCSKPGIDSEWLDNAPDMQSDEKELLLFLLNQPENLDHYVFCPSFQAEQQRSLTAHLPASLPILKDAYLACAVTLKQLQSGMEIDVPGTSISVRHISTAMSTLRSLPVSCPQDAVLCHTLGSALAFSIYATIGVGVPDICRYCLSTTSRFAGTAAQSSPDAHRDPWQSFLVLLETMDCLVHRKSPTRRIELQEGPSAVDLHLGLCLPLLPYYQDLCVISSSLVNTTDTSILARLQKQLDTIHAAVEAWQPSHSDQLIERFDSAEIINLLAQAKVYRWGALLVGHRLQYPFGQEDMQADIWSREILRELELTQLVTKRSMRFVTMPFMVAAVEVRDASLRIKTLQYVDDYVDHFSPFLKKAMKTFLSRVWHERDLNLTSRWFDSMHKPCPVLHSMDAVCFGSL